MKNEPDEIDWCLANSINGSQFNRYKTIPKKYPEKLFMTTLPNNDSDKQLGFALLRVMLGVNMLGRSLVRLPDIDGFASGMVDNFSDTILPGPFVYVYAIVILLVEAAVGIMLIAGWKTRWALTGMGALLISLAFGQILLQNFGTVANILIYAIAVTLLLFNTKYDYYGLDRGFK